MKYMFGSGITLQPTDVGFSFVTGFKVFLQMDLMGQS
jgi:hypothetical protein